MIVIDRSLLNLEAQGLYQEAIGNIRRFFQRFSAGEKAMAVCFHELLDAGRDNSTGELPMQLSLSYEGKFTEEVRASLVNAMTLAMMIEKGGEVFKEALTQKPEVAEQFVGTREEQERTVRIIRRWKAFKRDLKNKKAGG